MRLAGLWTHTVRINFSLYLLLHVMRRKKLPKLCRHRVMMFTPLLIAMSLMLVPFTTLQAQPHKVSGQVTAIDDGMGLPGVNVLIKGSSAGTTTDANGNYILEVPDVNAVLIFSFIGYISQEEPVEGRTTIDVALTADIMQLSEVVVVGYGTQKRSDITGSVVSVPKDRLSKLPVTNLMHAIQGTTAGLVVTQSSSVPGSSGSWQIRGVNSINANTSPFVVVDGVPFFGATNDINPNDIESIEILKDASAVAIYGTRGANGVILITTKRGKYADGKPRIEYSGYYGVESMAHVLEPLGPDAYVQKYDDFMAANNLSKTAVLPNAAEVENYDNGITTDWLDEATQPGHVQQQSISIAGGTENIQYYVSGTHLGQKGVVKGYQYQKTSLRANLDATITDYLKIGVSSFYTANNYDGGRANFLLASAMSPYSVPYDDQGNYIIYPMSPEQLFANPLLGLSTDRLDRGRNLTGTGYASITPGSIPGLEYRMNASYVLTTNRYAYYEGRQANNNSGYANVNNSETANWVLENLVTYKRDVEKHHVDFTALYSAQQVDWNQNYASATTFINDALGYYNLDAGATQSSGSDANSYTMLSQMGRINYAYDSRFLLTLTARRDGYSAFGVNTNKYATFPSMAVGWNIQNEQFLRNTEIVSQLKLRFSYGESGNMAIPVNQTASLAGTVKFPFEGSAQTGILFNTLGNNDLNWETTTGTNLAVDFGLFQNRISGTIEGYKTVTKDILLQRSLPGITGYSSVWANLGEMQNLGIELTLKTINLQTGKFTWETALNFASYRNEIKELYGDGEDDVGNRWFIGHPLRVVYDYKKLGVWQEGDDFTSDPDANPGDLKFKDQDGNHQITGDDRVIIGQRDPRWTGGITNNFTYGNFTLNIFIQTSQGGLRTNNNLTYADEAGRRNLPKAYHYWTAENPSNYWPSLSSYKNYRGFQFTEEFSYVRIKDIRFSYRVPNEWLDRYGIKNMLLYLSGRNIYTFTDWIGWDPENSYDSRGSGNWTNNYPLVRTISLGLNVTL